MPYPFTLRLQVLRLVKHHGLAISKFELESLGARNPRYGWSRKGFAGLVKALPKLTHLRVSDLQSCALSLKPLLSLQGLTALVLSIQVERPSITYDLGCLSHLKNLRRLMFDVVQHTGTVHLSGSLSKLDRLSALHFGLMGRGTSGTGVMDIVRNMAILHELSLTGKLFRKIDLAGITSLRSLDLALPLATADWNIPLEEQLLPLLHMPYLSSLTLDQVPDKTSYVSWHTIWQSLRSVPELRNIKVCDTDLSMLEDEDWIFGTQLKNLTLAACQLERFPMALLDMTNLSSLALYHNALPNLPAGSYLQQLTMLDLSYNSMEDIPAALVLCSSLKSLTWDSMDDDGVCWDRAILKGLLPDGCELHEDD